MYKIIYYSYSIPIPFCVTVIKTLLHQDAVFVLQNKYLVNVNETKTVNI